MYPNITVYSYSFPSAACMSSSCALCMQRRSDYSLDVRLTAELQSNEVLETQVLQEDS